MGGGNGAKSASKRERNAKAKGPEAKSILKEKEKMMSQMCMICRVRSWVLSNGREICGSPGGWEIGAYCMTDDSRSLKKNLCRQDGPCSMLRLRLCG